MAEQQAQMLLFVEDMATGEKRQATALPLTDGLMEALFPDPDCDNGEEPLGMINDLLAKSRTYGAQLGRLAYVEGKMVESVMDASIISWVDGVNAVHRLDPEEREQLRNAAFVAAFGAAQKTASAC